MNSSKIAPPNAPAFMDEEKAHPSSEGGYWGSDAVADTLRALNIPYIALNPGASYRGLHDSLVNHLGNEAPKILVVLHEEHAVALAHGWAKVEDRAMAAVVHSNVGLMHATMAVFNAWCDRAPLILLGATGPLAAEKRRHWVEWIHTAQDQGSLVRNYVKWDHQAVSAPAAVEALLRANKIANTAPCGPTYVCLDLDMQETQLPGPLQIPGVDRYRPPASAVPDAHDVDKVASALMAARRPLILCGRARRDEVAWAQRVALAETLGARVLTDLRSAASFPTNHALHVATAGIFPTDEGLALIRQADVLLSLDWVDLGGTLRAAGCDQSADLTVFQVSVDQHVHNGWSMDHQVLAPSDLHLMNEVEPAVRALLERARELNREQSAWPEASWLQRQSRPESPRSDGSALDVPALAVELHKAMTGQAVCLVRLPSGWPGNVWPFEHPLDYLGFDGGGGLGSGPGLTVGAALALRGKGRLAVGVLGDGDFLMGVTAIWTAVHYGIPGMIVIANNSSFYNDETHQERVADVRGRRKSNKWIGMRIARPEIDMAQLARGQGAVGFGPVRGLKDLRAALEEGIAAVRSGHFVVIDVRVEPS